MYFEAFDILTADIENKIHLWFKMASCAEMRHCLNDANVYAKRIFDYLLIFKRFFKVYYSGIFL